MGYRIELLQAQNNFELELKLLQWDGPRHLDASGMKFSPSLFEMNLKQAFHRHASYQTSCGRSRIFLSSHGMQSYHERNHSVATPSLAMVDMVWPKTLTVSVARCLL